jgi:hypothetical protein
LRRTNAQLFLRDLSKAGLLRDAYQEKRESDEPKRTAWLISARPEFATAGRAKPSSRAATPPALRQMPKKLAFDEDRTVVHQDR